MAVPVLVPQGQFKMTELDRFPLPSGGDRPVRRADHPGSPSAAGFDEAEALVEQAKGVLMFCRGLSAQDAGQVLLEWSRDRGVPATTVARVLVHDISQGVGSKRSDATHQELIRWLEARLRQ